MKLSNQTLDSQKQFTLFKCFLDTEYLDGLMLLGKKKMTLDDQQLHTLKKLADKNKNEKVKKLALQKISKLLSKTQKKEIIDNIEISQIIQNFAKNKEKIESIFQTKNQGFSKYTPLKEKTELQIVSQHILKNQDFDMLKKMHDLLPNAGLIGGAQFKTYLEIALTFATKSQLESLNAAKISNTSMLNAVIFGSNEEGFDFIKNQLSQTSSDSSFGYAYVEKKRFNVLVRSPLLDDKMKKDHCSISIVLPMERKKDLVQTSNSPLVTLNSDFFQVLTYITHNEKVVFKNPYLYGKILGFLYEKEKETNGDVKNFKLDDENHLYFQGDFANHLNKKTNIPALFDLMNGIIDAGASSLLTDHYTGNKDLVTTYKGFCKRNEGYFELETQKMIEMFEIVFQRALMKKDVQNNHKTSIRNVL